MRYELETSWHVLIASAPSIGYGWGPAACRRWNEDVFSPFQDSNQLHRQSPDYCARRIPNAPNSVLDSSGGPDATTKRCRFDILSLPSPESFRTRRENAVERRPRN